MQNGIANIDNLVQILAGLIEKVGLLGWANLTKCQHKFVSHYGVGHLVYTNSLYHMVKNKIR